jgi:transaldolase
MQLLMDCLLVEMDAEIWKIIPERISAERNAHHSLDIGAPVETTRELINLY